MPVISKPDIMAPVSESSTLIGATGGGGGLLPPFGTVEIWRFHFVVVHEDPVFSVIGDWGMVF